MDLVPVGCPLAGRSARCADPTEGEEVPIVWAHCPYVVQRAVTNRTTETRRVAKVSTLCACLAAKVAFEGSLVQGENLDGFGTYDVKSTYADPKTGKPKIYKAKASQPVKFVSQSL